jgi:hypothetical protein
MMGRLVEGLGFTIMKEITICNTFLSHIVDV